MKKKLNIINKFRDSIFVEYLPMFLIMIALLLVALYLLNIDSKNIVVWYGIPSKISLSGDFRFYPTNEKGQMLDEQWFWAVPKDINDVDGIQKNYEIIEPRGIYKITGTRNKDDCDYYKNLNEVGNFPCVASLTLLDIIRIGTTTAPIARTNEELCKFGTFTTLLYQEIKFNQEITKDRFVQYLRTTLNNWLSGKYGTITKPKLSDKCEYGGLLRDLQCPDAVFTDVGYGIPEIGEEYLKSKFIVLQTDPAPGGGESIVLMFKDKPNKVFYAWVYRYYDTDPLDPKDIQGFDLRALNEYSLDDNDVPSIKETQKMFINQLCSQEAGI